MLAALALVVPAAVPAMAGPFERVADGTGAADTVGGDVVDADDGGKVTLLVRWADDVAATARAAVRRELGAVAAQGGRDLGPHVQAVEVPGDEAGPLADALEARAEVEVVERDRVVRIPPPFGAESQAAELTTGTVSTAGSATAGLPAELFREQWGLENVGQLIGPLTGDDIDDDGMIEGIEGVDVRARAAWERTFGDPEVVVGVIDTPMDLDHPDLDGSIIGEIDLRDPQLGDGATRSHGTQVASVIAAGSDTGGTMLGLAPEVSILSLAAFTGEDGGPGESTLSSLLAAFEAARAEGVDVVNASWVGTLAPDESGLLAAAIADTGVPVVAASGNDSLDLTVVGPPRVPVSLDVPNLVSATAIDPRGEVPGFANIGRGVVDVGAPGRAVLVALPDEQGYGLASGTSFSAPLVSAAIALGRVVEPNATASELVDAVRWTSRAEASLLETTTSGGMLDAGALVTAIPRPVCGGPQDDAGFPDVSEDAVHAKGIDCIAANGITAGRADGTYGPAAPVSRAEMAVFLARVVERITPELPDPQPSGFEDVDAAAWYAPSVDRLVQFDIVHGDTDNRFRPGEPVRRGQVSAFLVRTVDALAGDPQPPTRHWFDDVAGTTHADAVNRARGLGLARGIEPLIFAPSVTTRRDQMASLLARMLDTLAREGLTVR